VVISCRAFLWSKYEVDHLFKQLNAIAVAYVFWSKERERELMCVYVRGDDCHRHLLMLLLLQ